MINIYDKRNSQIVKTFKDIHSSKKITYLVLASELMHYMKFIYIDWITCVRWDEKGERLASASYDRTAKVLDFASEKVIYTGKTADESKYFVINCY